MIWLTYHATDVLWCPGNTLKSVSEPASEGYAGDHRLRRSDQIDHRLTREQDAMKMLPVGNYPQYRLKFENFGKRVAQVSRVD